ncbi:MAG: hypothetical protein ACI9HE_002157 [Planctomycetota bacterium]|jgi:hypothetical protein
MRDTLLGRAANPIMTGTSERIEVEAEPYDPTDDKGPRPQPKRTSRGSMLARLLASRYGTLIAGGLLDAVDFTTLGALGVKFGFPIGCLCGWWLSSELRYPKRMRFGIAVACGLYCMFPPTTYLPVAVILGLMAPKMGWAPHQQKP